MRKDRLLPRLAALVPVMMWGTSFIASKTMLAYTTPVCLMWLRFLIAYAVLWVLHPKWKLCGKDEAMFLLLALFSNTVYFLAENNALKYTQTTNVSIIVATAPLLSALLTFLLHGERITRRQLVCYVVALLGAALVILNGVFVLHLNPLGDLLAFGAAVCWTLYGLLVRRYTDKYNSFLLSRKLMFYGLLSAAPLLLGEGGLQDLGALLQPKPLLNLLFLGVGCSGISYVLWNVAIRRLGLIRTAAYLYFNPLFTLLAAALLLGEPITPMGLLGVALVIGGMVMSAPRQKEGEPA